MPTVVIIPKRATAEPLVLRAQAALEIGLASVATRDLRRAAQLPDTDKDPYVRQARQELAKLGSQAAEEMAGVKATVEKIRAKPLVDCKAGKKPGTFCDHDVAEQVAKLKCLSRIYSRFEEVRDVEKLLAKLRPLPGYKDGNRQAMAMSHIDGAKILILEGKYWPAFRALRQTKAKSKDDCVKQLTDAEMAYLKTDPKVSGIIKMGLQAEAVEKQRVEVQMQCLEQARSKSQSDPAAARKLYQKLIDEHPLSGAAKLAKEELAQMSRR